MEEFLPQSSSWLGYGANAGTRPPAAIYHQGINVDVGDSKAGPGAGAGTGVGKLQKFAIVGSISE